MCIRIHTYASILSYVPFAGLFAGLKLARLNPTKCHSRMPRKKKIVSGAPQKSKHGLPYSSQLAPWFFARPFYD